ncbi:hypothetical protein [Kitasatospora nipponensis]
MEPRRDDSPSLLKGRPSELKHDLDAALQTRKELGAEYESELIDSFLSRIDARLDARVEQRVAERLSQYEDERPLRRRDRDREGRRRGWSGNPISPVSLVMAIPLTAIGSSQGGFGIVVCWLGIVGVNFAAAFGARRDRREEQRTGREARGEWA